MCLRKVNFAQLTKCFDPPQKSTIFFYVLPEKLYFNSSLKDLVQHPLDEVSLPLKGGWLAPL